MKRRRRTSRKGEAKMTTADTEETVNTVRSLSFDLQVANARLTQALNVVAQRNPEGEPDDKS